ncbi:hypothetical protein [Zavarzinella formosa]|uniref:hypothetical protein n=1 Tax=Zavarzinella formosa TaxID=360055 RepID=UPI0002F81F95|nr:hypothetical protein [Zavarzinella formosa]
MIPAPLNLSLPVKTNMTLRSPERTTQQAEVGESSLIVFVDGNGRHSTMARHVSVPRHVKFGGAFDGESDSTIRLTAPKINAE